MLSSVLTFQPRVLSKKPMITDILVEPVGREFDTAQLAEHLEKQPHTARDSVQRDIFMLAENSDELAAAREARLHDAKRFPTTVILVDLGPRRIEISYRTAHVGPGRRFVEWLRTQHELKFLDEEFNDLTPYVTGDLDFLFGT